MKEDNSTEQVGSLKKRELCLKKLPHDFKLVVPDFMNRHENDNLTQEQVELYYMHMESLTHWKETSHKILTDAGISLGRYFLDRKVTRYYRCTVCGKKEYDLKIKNV